MKMYSLRSRYARRFAVALVVGLAGSLVAGPAGAQKFDALTASVDLAGYQPDKVTIPVEIAKPIAGSFEAVKLALTNADAPLKGPFERYEVEAEPAAQAWRVDSVTKTMQRKPVGRFRLTGGAITFQFEAGITRVDGGPLRNCVVVIDDGGKQHAVALRTPVRQTAWPLDLKKEISRFALADDLPEASELTLEVLSVDNSSTPAAIGPAKVSLKESSFAELKAADASNPGAQLRIVLWKAGLKPEVLVRPELTPIAGQAQAQQQPAQPPVGRPQTGQPVPGRPAGTKATAKPADDFDPTVAARLRTLSFTVKGIADIKTQLGRELAAGNNQYTLNQNRITANQRELAKWAGGIVGTQAEIDAILAKIRRLEDENRQLNFLNQQFANVVLPNLNRQIAACPALDQLANTLNGKASLSFRVTYQVQGKPIEAMVVAGAPPSSPGEKR